MAISSQRFKFLDEETNIGTKDFLSLTDNSVYTAVTDSADSVVSSIREGENTLSTMEKSISDLMDKVSNASKAVMQKIKDALNAAINKIMSMKLPKFVTKILDSLKELDLGGVTSFFKDLLRVGSAFLCNNLDFLKSFMLGYSLTENILSGLMIGLLLTWLDRYCKGFSKQEVLSASNKRKLGMMFGNDGVSLTPETVLGKFSNAYRDLIRFSNPYTPNLPYGTQEFLTRILNGEGDEGIRNLRNAEISSFQRKQYISFLDQKLGDYTPNSVEYNQILNTRASLITTPLIAEERIEKANNFSNLNDALGSIALNIKDIDTKDINVFTLNETEKTLLVKLEEFKQTALNNKDIQTRDKETGSFDDFDFTNVFPDLTPEETQYLESLPGLEDSYRYNGLHPTTEVFTEESVPGSTRLTVEQEPIQTKPNTSTAGIGVTTTPNAAPSNPLLGTTFTPSSDGLSLEKVKTLNDKPSIAKGTNLSEKGTGKFDKPYKPTPVIPGSCYA